MTADEMFRKLGYKQVKAELLTDIEYRDNDGSKENYNAIIFDLTWKNFGTLYYDTFIDDLPRPLWVNVEVFQAIAQKMKELGWLD
jgi:hypothetical protein